MSHLLQHPGWAAAALILTAWLISASVRSISARLDRWRQQRRFRRARRGERDAERLLRKRGYEIIDSQVEANWTVWLDDEAFEITVCADYVVRDERGRYVAEVKTGECAPSVRQAETRRQLLEYLFAFQADGVLLVDMEERWVRRVEFDL